MHPWETLLPWKSKEMKCCLYEMPYVAAPIRVLGDIIMNSTPYARLPTDAPTRARTLFSDSWVMRFIRDPSCHIKTPTWNFYKEIYKWRGGPETDYLLRFLRSPAKSTSSVSASRLRSDSLSWERASGSQRNKLTARKGMLSNQSWLTCITPTAFLVSWVLQPIEGVTSLGTDFEKHAIWQGSVEEPAAKEFVARKVRTIKWSKVQRTIWNAIKCKERLRSHPAAVVRQAPFNLIHEFGNPFGIPFPGCTALT